jgi:hypothetical protein
MEVIGNSERFLHHWVEAEDPGKLADDYSKTRHKAIPLPSKYSKCLLSVESSSLPLDAS